MTRFVACLVFATLALASPAEAVIKYEHRMPQPPVLVDYHDGCPDGESVACADPETARVWVAPGAGRFAWSHEIGHVWWHQVATERDRRWITYQLGWPRYTEWYGDAGMPSPSELSADAYAACDLGLSPKRQWITSYGYLPNVREHRRICARIKAIGLAH